MRNDIGKQIKHKKKSPCNSIMLHQGGIQLLGSADKHQFANWEAQALGFFYENIFWVEEDQPTLSEPKSHSTFFGFIKVFQTTTPVNYIFLEVINV